MLNTFGISGVVGPSWNSISGVELGWANLGFDFMG
jgi:hypothetical protein